MEDQSGSSRLILDDRKRLSLTGVDGVEGFTEQYLKLSVKGVKLLVSGSGIKITAFNKASGVLTADGDFFEIKYGKAKTPVFKRIFK